MHLPFREQRQPLFDFVLVNYWTVLAFQSCQFAGKFSSQSQKCHLESRMRIPILKKYISY